MRGLDKKAAEAYDTPERQESRRRKNAAGRRIIMRISVKRKANFFFFTRSAMD